MDFQNISIDLLPSEWSQILKLSYIEQSAATVKAGSDALEASKTANEASETVKEQGIELSEIKQTQSKHELSIRSNAETASSALSSANSAQGKIEGHITGKSAHGVIGENVGTENFAQETIGGVVLLASNVDELLPLTINVPAAPASYDQLHAQAVVDAVNSIASKQGDIIKKINEIIQASKSAKQMSSV